MFCTDPFQFTLITPPHGQGAGLVPFKVIDVISGEGEICYIYIIIEIITKVRHGAHLELCMQIHSRTD